jgi:uncharacterized membrane protein YecN with MAPEG domain
MLKAILLILEPMATWDKIVLAKRGLFFVLLAYVVPLLLITSFCEGYGLVHWGKPSGQVQEVAHLKSYTRGEAVIYEATQFLLSLVVVFAGAKMAKSIGETFHGRHTFTQSFVAVAYGLGPFFLLRLLDTFPSVNPWVTWTIGIVLTIATLYHGLPRMMEPDPTHAFGLFLMSSLLLVLITGLMRFLTWWYLAGKLPPVESFISDLGARLPL